MGSDEADPAARAVADEDLLDDGPGPNRRRAEAGVVDRDRAPAQRFLPFLTDDAVAFPSHLIPLPDVARQKDHPRAVAPGERQIDAQRRRDLAEKPIRHLDQNAGTIPGIRFAAAGPSMQQVDENLEAAFDDAV